jgi:ABC-type oligopeptide transport system substrate-binding subunit
MRKKTNVLLLGAISVLASAALTGCGSGSGETYTYVEGLTESPDMWNVHSWKENTESIIFGYTEMGLYDFTLGENNQGYTIVPEMADGEPVDDSANVTAEEIDEYGLTGATDTAGNVQSGVKWLINLNKKACWQDGTAITADDYVNSMDRLLDPAMVNYRADSWYSGNVVLGNAEARFKSGRTMYENLVQINSKNKPYIHTGTPVNDHYYANLYQKVGWLSNYSFSGLIDATGATEDNLPLCFALLADTDTWGTSASPKNVDLGSATSKTTAHDKYLAAIQELNAALKWGSVPDSYDVANDESGNCLGYFVQCGYAAPETAFSSVGIKKTGDYQIALYLVRPASLFYLKEQLSGNWIVKTDLYDANKSTAGSLTTTTYATSLDTYMSYGPYKLTTFTPDKEVIVEKNDKWYGYTDGNHTDQYQITKFDMQVVESLDTQLLMFEKGQLDSITLRAQDMSKYSTSPYLMYTPQSYTDKIALNSDFTKLKSRQEEQSATDKTSINKTILANVKFRQALSWALDRTTFVQTETAGSTPALGVINDMYVADVDSGILYRDTDSGKRVISDIYGDSKDGFNLSKAKQLITDACEEEAASTKDGHYKTGDKVSLEFVVYNEDWRTAIQNHIDDFVAATVGTPLENKFEVTITITENNQDTILAGNAELCMDIWGGAQMNPYGIPDTWINAENRTCYGYNPDNETIDIDLNGDGSIDKTTERMSHSEWYTALNDGEYSAANADYLVRSNILSWLEEDMLAKQFFITIRARNSVGLDSFRVQEGTDTYQALVGYGGVRAMKLTKSDQTWATTAAAGLDYTK